MTTPPVTPSTSDLMDAHEEPVFRFGRLVYRGGRLVNPINAVKGAIAGLSAMVVGRFLGDTVKAAAESEAAWGRVESAVTNASISFNLVRDNLDAMFSSIQRTTRFSDDAAADAFSQLLTISNDYAGSLKNLALVTDVAAAKKLDLKAAAELVGKVMVGEMGTLKRYGIVVQEGADALEVMHDRFRGFAARDAKTMQGQLEQLANAWDGVQEAIGRTLLIESAKALRLRAGVDVAEELAVSPFLDSRFVAGELEGHLGDPRYATRPASELATDLPEELRERTLPMIMTIAPGNLE